MKRSIPSVLIFTILLLYSCAPKWVATDGQYTMASQKAAMDLPKGWKRYEGTPNDILLITKDGISLQTIKISVASVETALPFTKKKILEGMLPQEAAEVLLDDFRSNPNALNLDVIDNRPAMIGGHPGFKLVCDYKSGELNRKSVAYGFILGKRYYLITYDAPARHYYEKDIAAFEKIKESFVLKD